jgi:hypothetical protein
MDPATALVFFMLNQDHKWDFFAVERGETRLYCEVMAKEAMRVFSDIPGNVLIICMDDKGEEI